VFDVRLDLGLVDVDLLADLFEIDEADAAHLVGVLRPARLRRLPASGMPEKRSSAPT